MPTYSGIKKIKIGDNIFEFPIPTVTLNGSSSLSPSFYAPTGAGTSGYYLKSNGSGAPTWEALPADSDEKVSQTNTSDNYEYRVLFSNNANDNNETTGARKNTNLKYNPSTATLTTNNIKANKGIFNYLEVEDLTAQTATVVGLLDVKGEIHTNKWTSTNIANIGGSFYISPTYKSSTAKVTFGGSANSRSIAVTNGSFGSTTANGLAISAWVANSKVMVTGSITYLGTTYPLGTCTGTLSAAMASTGFTITGVNSDAIETLYEIIGTTQTDGVDIQISMYAIAGTKPVGILLTSYGTSQATYLDIYGGTNNNTGTPSVPNADPNLRIGYLTGLPTFTVGGVTTVAPQGWGIYTDNGYFKGHIVADGGIIGGYTIGTDNLTKGTTRDANGSFWITPAQSSSSSMSKLATAQWAITTGQNFGVTTAGKLYATGAEINGEIKADSGYIASSVTIGSGGTTTIGDVNTTANNASYSVEIEVKDIDYVTGKLSLTAHVYKLGVRQTGTNLNNISFNWSYIKNVNNADVETVLTTSSAYNTQTITINSGAELEATYICTISEGGV